jgi:hypothetical protein
LTFRPIRSKGEWCTSYDTLRAQCIIPKLSKPIIDEIDHILAKYYAFSEEEVDFLINRDIKYRLGGIAEIESMTEDG